MVHAVRALVVLSLIVAAGTAGMILARPGDGAAETAPGLNASALPEPLEGAAAPRIRLRDAEGRMVDSRRLAGRPYLVTFVYTRCPDYCPLIGAKLARALDVLGPRARELAALAVSVDPRGDTPARARRWLAQFGLPGQVRYLLGTPAELRPVWRDWFLLAQDRRALDPVTHAASIWLVDARGRLRGRWAPDTPVGPSELAHDLKRLLEEGSRRPRS